MSSRYFRVSWTDINGAQHLSDPICKWTSAMLYAMEIGGNAHVLTY